MFLLFRILYCQQYKIRLFGTDHFINGDTSKESQAHLVNINESTNFNFRSDLKNGNKVYITVNDEDAVALKLDRKKKTLLFSSLAKTNNHQFRFVPVEFDKRTFWLTNHYDCIGWNETKVLFEPMICDENNNNQLFQIFPLDAKEEIIYGKGESLLHNKKEILTENVIRSHEMENEGENIISGIFNALDKFDLCMDKKGVCNYTIDFLDAYYKSKGYSAYSSSYSSSADLHSSLSIL